MVIRSRRGGSNLGCIVSLVLFVAALYYGIHIGEVYLRYYQLVQEMRAQARLAPSLTDEVIRRRLITTVAELDLPASAHRISISRSARPAIIVIEARYEEKLDLPLFHHTFKLHPRAEEAL